VFECLEDSDADLEGYDALEDDFILLANEGKIAVKTGLDEADEEQERLDDQDDKDVVFVDDQPGIIEDEELREYRLRMAALLPTQKSVPTKDVQKDLDANFNAFMDREYADDLIGDLDSVENED
jgi:hypothetical protein